MSSNTPRAPWLKFYKEADRSLNYPDCSMVDFLMQKRTVLSETAYVFMGKSASFKKFYEEIERCARSLVKLGVKRGDAVTICMPNTPHAIIMFYALNKIGAIANMVHPLSSEGEIEFYLKQSNSSFAITLLQFFPKFKAIEQNHPLKKLIIAKIDDFLPTIKAIGYRLTIARKFEKAESENVIFWNDFLKMGQEIKDDVSVKLSGDDPAVILYSGGTTGTTKGILLTNLNFNALALQTATAGDIDLKGTSMLAIMPIFHGFGLGVCIHTALVGGCYTILVPQFSVKTIASLFKQYKPNCMAGVPTLFEAMLRSEDMKKVDLSCLIALFSGGDTLTVELKSKVDAFLKERGAKITVREGYGLTECVTASCLTPKDLFKKGSIGIPFPDTFYKIVESGTTKEVEYGTMGEICISGPTLMKEYINNPEETANTLKVHDDGRTWLHTGDVGTQDEDGFIYFRQRLKRIIITSGYNVYPSQLENIIDSHEAVLISCVIGVKDSYKMAKVKAFVVLKNGYTPSEEIKRSIFELLKKNVAKYALPYEIEFKDDIPKTLVGKVAYTVLEKKENENLS